MNTELCVGIFFGVIFIMIFFGAKIETKSTPKIKINIGNFIRDSHSINIRFVLS
jgi:hypothetical protein